MKHALGKALLIATATFFPCGSLMNVIGETRHFEQAGARPDLKDFAFLRSQAERLEADWCRLGMDQVYASAEDMLLESQRLHARQRLIGFDTSGVLLGSYRLGKGRFVINAFRILESLGNNPTADRLMLNLVTEGVKRSSPER